MARRDATTAWTKRVAKHEARPRVLFDDRMVVFAVNGSRPELYPLRKQSDGFDGLDHDIYVAGPHDLRPENHEALKATLAEKIEEAKALPFSKSQKLVIQRDFLGNVIERAIVSDPGSIIRHFAPLNKQIQKKYNSPKAIERIEDGTNTPYDLLELLKCTDGQSSKDKLYLTLKKLFRNNGQQEEFAAIEREAAEEVSRFWIDGLSLPQTENDTLLQASLVIRLREHGGQKISINTKPIEATHRRLIEQAYHDLDAVINQARKDFIRRSQKKGIADPFEYTQTEQKKIKEIDDIAHRHVPMRPVMLAGYSNPKLTIIINSQNAGTANGISYGDLQLIEIFPPTKDVPFDHVLMEELLHQAMENIYHNNSLPYRNDGDNRKALLQKALSYDFPNQACMNYIGFSRVNHYNTDNETSRHQELPVKVMKYASTPVLEELRELLGPSAYHKTERYAQKVIIQDAIDHNNGIPLPDIADDYARVAKRCSPSPRNDGQNAGSHTR